MPSHFRLPANRAVLVTAAATVVASTVLGGLLPASAVAAACPVGYEAEPAFNPATGIGAIGPNPCKPIGMESFDDVSRAADALSARSLAGMGALRSGALDAGVQARDALVSSGAVTPGTWQPVGGTLHSDVSGYARVNGLGLAGLSGRVEDFAADPSDARHWYAAVATGGLWETNDAGASWHSVSDSMPTQTAGAVAYLPTTPATLVLGTGDPSFGGDGISGLGVFRSTDDGATWTKASGVPGDSLTFSIAVDPDQPSTLYAATSKGLYRSDDAGASFVNVQLPTKCTDLSDANCYFANMVTDVVVQKDSGKVLAAVGWRAGQKNNANGKPQAPQNGLYSSDSGLPGSFKYDDPSATGFLATNLVGRTALGIANGPGQDHGWVAAVVQDAGKFNGTVGELDTPQTTAPDGSILNGIWLSKDFGATWNKVADAADLALPGTGSALTGANLASYRPGVQSWYNEWVQFDPTQHDSSGAPTRMAFGLEEVWENTGPLLTTTKDHFHVIGRYFAGGSCAGYNLGLPACPTNNPPQASTTTHPDQHAGLFVPDGQGGVTLLAGNDGGAYAQHVASGQDFDNTKWGSGVNDGLHTLLPYATAVAKDGTIVAGLQDNGEMKVTPEGNEVAIFGGDGFYSAIDPNNSNTIYEEYTNGDVSVSTDGGKSWTDIKPSGLTSALFATPLTMDPYDAGHLLMGGRDIEERTGGPGGAWTKVYDLGTRTHPGVASATATAYNPATPSVLGDPNNQTSAVDLLGGYAYAGFCGYCDVVTGGLPFQNGLATNVTRDPKTAGTAAGWHIAKMQGLPDRYITSVRMDPSNPAVVYVTLGGYGRRWIAPGALGDDTSKVGTGHVFRSGDGGDHFVDITGNLPDVPANWTIVHNGHLVVATDVGVFESGGTHGESYQVLGNGMPSVPVFHLTIDPSNPDRLIAATYGRGVYDFTYPTGGIGPVLPEAPIAALLPLAAVAAWWVIRRRRHGRAEVAA